MTLCRTIVPKDQSVLRVKVRAVWLMGQRERAMRRAMRGQGLIWDEGMPYEVISAEREEPPGKLIQRALYDFETIEQVLERRGCAREDLQTVPLGLPIPCADDDPMRCWLCSARRTARLAQERLRTCQ